MPHGSPATPPPTTTVTTTAAPPSAAEQLSDKRDESLGRLVTDGDWAVSLSAKQDGTRDDRQLTSSGSHVFRLPDILELHEEIGAESIGSVLVPTSRADLLWGIARLLAAHGAEVALTYQGDAFGKRVRPLAAEIGSEVLIDCDVENVASVNAAFDALEQRWGRIDFVVHAIAFSDKSELKGLYADTTRENFVRTMVISCFSFTEVARRVRKIKMHPENGSSSRC